MDKAVAFVPTPRPISGDGSESRRPCVGGCNEWITDWWMPLVPPPTHTPTFIGTTARPDRYATTGVDRATTTLDRRTTTVEGSTTSADRRTTTVDPPTKTVDPSTTSVVGRTPSVDRRTESVDEHPTIGVRPALAQTLRGGMDPSRTRPAGTACLSGLMGELRRLKSLPPARPPRGVL